MTNSTPDIDELINIVLAERPNYLPSDIPVFVPIDSQLSSNALVANATGDDHVYLAVEPLLEEASSILGRCLANRRYKYELEEKALSAWLTDRRDFALLDANQALADAGQHKIPVEVAENGLAASASLSACAAAAQVSISESLAQRQPGDKTYEKRVKDTGELTNYLAQTSGARASLLAKGLEEIRVTSEVPPINLAREEWQSREIHNEKERFGYEKNIPYLRVNETVAQLKLDADRDYLLLRRAASNSQGSAFNYADRIREVHMLFSKDLASARNRCEAARRGLREVYGIDAPTPDISDPEYLSNLINWVRDQLDAVSLISEHSTTFVWSINLSECLSSDQLALLFSGKRFKFDVLPAPFVSDLRMRAIHATSFGLGPQLIGSMFLEAPMRAVEEPSIHRSVVVGDVWSDDRPSRAGVSRSRTIFNRSPIGTWNGQFAFRSEPIRLLAQAKVNFVVEFELEGRV